MIPKDEMVINALGAVFLVVFLCILYYFRPCPKALSFDNKIAHISIDDCKELWKDLICKQAEYYSIFQNEFLGYLFKLHTQFGLKVTLYSFYEADSYTLSMLSNKFKNEFANSSDWLRVGYHWHSNEIGQNVPADFLIESFDKFQSAILHFADSSNMTQCLRLHYFHGDETLLTYLKQRGVETLLAADDNRKSYNLTLQEIEDLKSKGILQKSGVIFRPSTARFERYLTWQNICKQLLSEDSVILFTHEWMLLNQSAICYFKNIFNRHKVEPNIISRYKFQKTIKWLKTNNYNFY